MYLKTKRLDKLIKVSVSKDNLIIKVFLSKALEVENQVSYCVSLLYLVLLHIHKHLHKRGCGASSFHVNSEWLDSKIEKKIIRLMLNDKVILI